MKNVIEVEDTVCAAFSGKVPFTFFATNAGACNMPVQISLRLSDGANMIILPDKVLLDCEMIFCQQPAHSLGKPCYGSGHVSLIRDFYAHAAQGRRFPLDGLEGMKVMEMIFAVYKSRGAAVSIAHPTIQEGTTVCF